MVSFRRGDLFGAKVDALVNPVNCVGTMGKGLAKEFERRFPSCMTPYEAACKNGSLTPGRTLLVRLQDQNDLFEEPLMAIILFPTKQHWREKSNLKWIAEGLRDLKSKYKNWGISSVAMPRIGCGLGGLDWLKVRSLIENEFAKDDLRVLVYLHSD